MSFGIGIGDLIAVTQLALKSYNAYKSAQNDVENLSYELNSLRICADNVRDIPEGRLSDSQSEKREQLLKGCYSVVEELKYLLERYQSLDSGASKGRQWTKKNRKKPNTVLEKIKWVKEDPMALRSRLVSNIVLLNSFYMDCQCTKMEEMMTIQKESQLQFQSVQHYFLRPLSQCRQDTAASFASVASFDVSAGSDHKARSPWRNFCRELHDRGVRIRPENLTEQSLAQIAEILQAGDAGSSCESTGKIREHNPTKTDP
ncbi:hypothetical protein L211DRAFT_177324 [Terfezia boudieri ATCC MYA-4762]|uniref:Fungal N-terminal domain-containing protein n=1 Tax=Terfezia boudieri ATCC MYA-4762 TaxID=1051890 RepID=A0A3N4LVB1_9PEZI|nr:hypothetical protein L211DRAFT_177324 [Terfezia boudieri ATCC MYA-4762]